MSNEIEVNAGYRLTPCMQGKKNKLCFVSGRSYNKITVLLVNEIVIANVDQYGREYAKVKTNDGEYNLMPCNVVTDLTEVAEVCDIIRNSPE